MQFLDELITQFEVSPDKMGDFFLLGGNILEMGLYQARWEKWESVEQAMREQPRASNSAILCSISVS